MFDARLRPLIDPLLEEQGRRLARLRISANQVTLAGLALGLGSAALIATGRPGLALIPLLLSRLADGLDGSVARATRPTSFGGYLDITCDFFFYGAVPMAFVWLDPATNGAAGAFLLLAFYVNGTTFLGFAVLAERYRLKTGGHGVKTLYFTSGLLEGAETIAFLVAICLFPAWFSPMAWVFGALCFATALSRVFLAVRVFPE